MTNFIVYRLETPKGFGPFYSNKYKNRKLTSYHVNHYKNTIMNNMITSDHIFGWNSKEKMLSFIPSNTKLKRFIKDGFIINLYNPKNYIIFDDGQVAFIRSCVIDSYQLCDFFNK